MQSRGGFGLKNVDITDKNGEVVGVVRVQGGDEVLVITEQGKIMRTTADDVRNTGRVAQGVRLMDLDDGDTVVSVALLAKAEDASLVETPEE